MYSMATRDDEAIFASYVNCILLATIHAAAEGVTQEYSTDMPTMTLFGKRVSRLYVFFCLQQYSFLTNCYYSIYGR